MVVVVLCCVELSEAFYDRGITFGSKPCLSYYGVLTRRQELVEGWVSM